MKNLKKVLALVMAFAMAFTMMAGAAYPDQDEITATDAVELLSTLKVMQGKDDGLFHPTDTLTRAEVCRIIYAIRSGNPEDAAEAYADMPTTFRDVDDNWAKGYIKHCQTVGLISGRDEAGTIFGPNDKVTGVELAVICLRAMGYDPTKAGIGGANWSVRTVGLASEAGLLDGIDSTSITGDCSRQTTAQIIANMIDARTVRWSNDGERYTDVGEDNTPNKKVGREYLDLYSSIGTLVAIEGDKLFIDQTKSDQNDSDYVDIATNNTYIYETDFVKVSTDYSELIGQKVNVLFRDGKANSVIGVYPLEGNTVYTVNASDVEQDTSGDRTNRIKFDGRTYALESNARRIFVGTGAKPAPNNYSGVNTTRATVNGIDVMGVATSASDFKDLGQSADRFIFVDTDDNGKLDYAIQLDYNTGKTSYVSSSQLVAGSTYKHADENISEDIAKDDWVSIKWNMFDDCLDIDKAEHITGKLTATKKGTRNDGKNTKYDQYQIDSTWYSAVEEGILSQDDMKAVRAGDTVDAYVVNGVVVAIKRTSDSTGGKIADVAMFISTDTDLGTTRAKIALFDGTTRVVNVHSDSVIKPAADGSNFGNVYQFTISGGDYKFENLKTMERSNLNEEYYGGFTAVDVASRLTGDNKGETYAGYKVDDKANVLLYAGQDRKHITGKQYKNIFNDLKGPDGTSNPVATAAFYGDMDGTKRIGALAVKVKTLPSNIDTNDNYAYIIDGMKTLDANTVSYVIWDGKKVTEVTEEYSGDSRYRQKGLVIGYKSISGDNNLITDVEWKKMRVGVIESGGNAAITVIPVTGTAYANNVAPAVKDFDITSSTSKMWINSGNDYVADAEGGNIGIPDANDYNNSGNRINILYMEDVANDMDVFVIDTTGNLAKNSNPYVRNEGAPQLNPTKGGTAIANDSYVWDFADTTAMNVRLTPTNFTTETVNGAIALSDGDVIVSVTNAQGADVTNSFTLLPTTVVKTNADGQKHIELTYKVPGNAEKTDNVTAANFTIAPNGAPVGEYTLNLATTGGTEASIPLTIKGAVITSLAAVQFEAIAGGTNWTNTDISTGQYPNNTIKLTGANADGIADYTGFTGKMDITVNGAPATAAALAGGDKVAVTVTLTAKTGYSFQTSPALEFTTQLGGTNKISPVVDLSKAADGKITITYTKEFASTPASGAELNAKLSQGDQTITAMPGSDTVIIPKDRTLTVENSISDFTKVTTNEGGTVHLKDDATVASLDALGAMTGSAKKSVAAGATGSPTVDAKTEVSNALKIVVDKDSTAKMLGFSSTETLAAIAASTQSTYLNPVNLKVDGDLMEDKYVKAERQIDGKWVPLFAGTSGLNDGTYVYDATERAKDTDGNFTFVGLVGEKVTAVRFSVADAAFTSSTTPTATYTFTLR